MSSIDDMFRREDRERRGKSRMPTREEIEAEAIRLYMQQNPLAAQHGLLPERDELQEEGLIREAQHRLMSGVGKDMAVSAKEQRAYTEEYAGMVASEIGMELISKKDLRGMERERSSLHRDLSRFRKNLAWANRALAGAKLPQPQARPEKKQLAKKRVKLTQAAIMAKVRKIAVKKGMVHIEKDLGIPLDFQGQITLKTARRAIGPLLRRGELYKPTPVYLKPTEPRKEVRKKAVREIPKKVRKTPQKKVRKEVPRVDLSKPLDIGAAIRGSPVIPYTATTREQAKKKPEKTVGEIIGAIDDRARARWKKISNRSISQGATVRTAAKPKPKKKRQKRHVARTGKTTKKLNGAKKRKRRDGSTTYSFGADVWKVRRP